MNTISSTDDMIDSRDVIARIEELESDRDALQDAFTDADNASDIDPKADAYEELHQAAADARAALEAFDNSDEGVELAVLQALQEEAEGYSPDWKWGSTLIRDSYFKGYAQELADGVNAINKNTSWPNTCIDWDRAARELQMDYTSVEFDGVTYWVR